MLSLAVDVARHESRVSTRFEGSIGKVPAAAATSLAVVITELISNAVEHGLKYSSGEVVVEADRQGDELEIRVIDNGVGLEDAQLDGGLGLQIVKTLVAAELRGSIAWAPNPDGGTIVTLHARVA